MQRYLETVRYNVDWFKHTFDAGELEVKPPFQRNPVWTTHQKSSLIDSILRGYPIPELYLQHVTTLDGDRKYLIIDGQQRITSFLEFLEGKYALTGDDSRQWAGMTFDDLSSVDKRRFLEYTFVVRLLPDMPDEEIISIFQRLNRNVTALNQQELRHATYWGPFIKTMEGLAEHEFWGEADLFSTNEIRRTLDVEFVSELAVGLLHGMQNRKDSLDRWYELYEEEFEHESIVRGVFNKVLGELLQILPDISKTRWRLKSDFYTLFLVFSNHKDNLPLPSEKRTSARELLIDFGSSVTRFLRDTSEQGVPEEIVQYSWSVVRASSALINRKKRAEILEALLAPVWSS